MLFVVGTAMILLAVLVEDRQMVAAALVGFGAALMTIGVLLPRLAGPVKFGAGRFEAELIAAVQVQAQVQGLTPEETRHAVATARAESDGWTEWLEPLLTEAASGQHVRAPILLLAKQYVDRQRALGGGD